MTKWDVYEIIDDNFNYIERENAEGINEFYWDYDKKCYNFNKDFYNENKEKFFKFLKEIIDKYEEEFDEEEFEEFYDSAFDETGYDPYLGCYDFDC